jgi:hypothetical protein
MKTAVRKLMSFQQWILECMMQSSKLAAMTPLPASWRSRWSSLRIKVLQELLG